MAIEGGGLGGDGEWEAHAQGAAKGKTHLKLDWGSKGGGSEGQDGDDGELHG